MSSRSSELLEFQECLYREKEREVIRFLLKFNVNKPENILGCEKGINGVYEYRETYLKIYVQDEKRKYGDFIPWTPLQYVSACGKEKMVMFLLSKGANPNITDSTGRITLDIATHMKRKGVVKILNEYMSMQSSVNSFKRIQSSPSSHSTEDVIKRNQDLENLLLTKETEYQKVLFELQVKEKQLQQKETELNELKTLHVYQKIQNTKQDPKDLRHSNKFDFSSLFIDLERIAFVKELRYGGFGTIWNASQHIAVKKISKKRVQADVFQKEVMAHQHFHHPNVTKCYGWSEDPDSYYMLLELMDGDLTQLIGKNLLTIEMKRDILLQVAVAMTHMHEGNLVHRDLKTENVLFKKLRNGDLLIKLSDFGISKEKSPNHTSSVTLELGGTLQYMAPELLTENMYSFSSDVYAFGILMYHVLYESNPYSEEQSKLTFWNFGVAITKGMRPKIIQHVELFDCLKPLMEKCWHLDPKKRPIFTKICHELEILK